MDYIGMLSRQITAIQQAKTANTGKAVRGVIRGDMVSINGTKYPYDAVTDVLPVDGWEVWCQMSTDGQRAVVVGA